MTDEVIIEARRLQKIADGILVLVRSVRSGAHTTGAGSLDLDGIDKHFNRIFEGNLRQKGCAHDTDGDGNCPAHPDGCELNALRRFKAYVHHRLDEAGVPTNPDGPHAKQGCRVGERLDIALKPWTEQLQKQRQEVSAFEQQRSIDNHLARGEPD